MFRFPAPRSWFFLALLAVVFFAGNGRASAVDSDIAPPDILGTVPDFELLDRSGKTISREDLLGKVWIASFVLIRCPDAKCPQVTQTVERLQDELADRRDLLFVTFTVDPERDDPTELSHYADLNGADPDRWLFLTGSEDTIDNVLRSFHFRAGKRQKGAIDHSQKLVLVDRHGDIRGYFDGMQTQPPYPGSEEDFETNLRKLKRKTDEVLAPELPGYLPKDFPAFNAALNALSAVLLLAGWLAVRNRLVRFHIACMLSAIVVSSVFLAAYLFYHIVVKEGRPTRFTDQAPGAPLWLQYAYWTILGTHTLLAVFVAPLALFTAYQGLRWRIQRHVAIARWTLPIWLYVSVTGVVVYWMLYRLYPLT